MTEKLVYDWGPADSKLKMWEVGEDGWLRACMDPVGFSYQVAANLPLSDDSRLKLLRAENCAVRLRLLLELINIDVRDIYGCAVCKMPLLETQDIFHVPGSEGVVGAYVNANGYVSSYLINILAICKLIRYKVSSPNNNIILILSSIYLMYRHVHQMVTVRRLVYNHATAVILQGKPTATDSWFPGYSWTIAHCAHCARHIGWHFTHDSRGTRDTFTTEVPINDNLRWFAPREQRRKRIKTDDGRVAMFW